MRGTGRGRAGGRAGERARGREGGALKTTISTPKVSAITATNMAILRTRPGRYLAGRWCRIDAGRKGRARLSSLVSRLSSPPSSPGSTCPSASPRRVASRADALRSSNGRRHSTESAWHHRSTPHGRHDRSGRSGRLPSLPALPALPSLPPPVSPRLSPKGCGVAWRVFGGVRRTQTSSRSACEQTVQGAVGCDGHCAAEGTATATATATRLGVEIIISPGHRSQPFLLMMALRCTDHSSR